MQRWNLLVLGALAGVGAADARELVDGIAAQVGNEIVLVSEVEALAAPILDRLEQAGAPASEIGRARATILDRLIERRLVRIVVERAELGASDAEVDETIAAIAEENGLTPDELRESVERQGLSFDAYRERLRGEIEHAKVVNGLVASRVRVEDDEVRSLYERRYADQPTEGEEVHLRHLLVAFRSNDAAEREAVCARVAGALERVRGGESFDAVARGISEANPERGGDIGWVHVGNLAPWMRSAVDSLEPGATSEVLRTDFGCNLLELVERRSYETITYERAEVALRGELFEQRMNEAYLDFVDEVREQTYVERKGIYADTARAVRRVPDGAGSASP